MRTGFDFDARYPDALEQAHFLYGDTVRIWVSWPGVNPQPDYYNWAWYDRVIPDMGGRGLGVILVFASNSLHPAEAWAKLVASAAARYRVSAVAALEIGNEPNLAMFGGYDAPFAAECVSEAHRAARAQGWEKPLLIGGPAPVRKWQDYLATMKDTGLPSDAALAFHPYPDSSQTLASCEQRIKAAREVLPRRGLWLTECGWSVYDVAEDVQANREVNMVKLAKRKRAKACIIFRLRVHPSVTGRDAERGVIRADWSPRPAYDALRGVIGG